MITNDGYNDKTYLDVMVHKAHEPGNSWHKVATQYAKTAMVVERLKKAGRK